MRIGSYDRLARLQRNSETGELDALDQPIKAWTVIASFWVSKTHKSEDEAFAASQRYARRTVTFGCHFRSDVTETDRIEVDGVLYAVKGIREIGFREALEISAEWQS
ncbi:phage head closure protein [Pararhizobium gei]|uniref:phage head closure protein n=1 Tax=Pararhizobium gei TaxID=1395951 RepID=UPI0023DB74C3|nr:phage head closure protein [Rhizobium gei]